MILGRNPALWAALVAGLLNAAVVVFGVPLTGEGVAALNAAALAIIGLVANESDRGAVTAFAPTLRDRRTAEHVPGIVVGPTYSGPDRRRAGGGD